MEINDIQEYFPFWDKLDNGQRIRLYRAADFRRTKKKTLLHGNDSCLGIVLVKSGQLRIFSYSEEGREFTLYRLFERDICLFSASCIMHDLQMDLMIETEKDSEYWVINADVYRSLMDESAPIANYTNSLMASRFTSVMWLLNEIMFKSMDKRLSSFLVEETRIEDSQRLKITHEQIANHLGTAREVVTRTLQYLQGEGLVSLSRGTIDITDIAGLEELAE